MTIKTKSISKDQLKEKIENGDEIEIVNVLSKESASQGMIKGSKNIPLGELDERLHEIDKSKPVVVYCKDFECQASPKAAEKLAENGFDVIDYEGGITEWKEAGYPLNS